MHNAERPSGGASGWHDDRRETNVAPIEGGYAARRGSLPRSTLPEACHASWAACSSHAIPDSCAEADRDLGTDMLALAQNVIQVLAGNARRIGDRGLGQLERRQDALRQQRTGVSGAALRIPFCNDFAIPSESHWQIRREPNFRCRPGRAGGVLSG